MMKMNEVTLEDRKLTQTFTLEQRQILKLREISNKTGRSLSDLARQALDKFLEK
jgi:hypothetical protein